MSTNAYILDLKTTSRNVDIAQPIEVGLVEVRFVDGKLEISEPMTERCKPDSHISFAAMASTGITNEDLVDKESFRRVLSRIMPLGYHYMIGHSISAALRVVRNSGVDICHYRAISTLSLAQYLVPNADNHKIKTLSYMFDYAFAKEYAVKPRSAGMDALACARILKQLCSFADIHSFDHLHRVSLELAIPTHFTFGVHKGESIKEAAKTVKGRNYLNWVVNNITNNPFAVEACRRALEGREIRSMPNEKTDIPIPVEKRFKDIKQGGIKKKNKA